MKELYDQCTLPAKVRICAVRGQEITNIESNFMKYVRI